MTEVTYRHKLNGHALLAFRKVAGKTQVSLAEASDVNHSLISRWERGQRMTCRREVLERLASALNVPASALLAAQLED